MKMKMKMKMRIDNVVEQLEWYRSFINFMFIFFLEQQLKVLLNSL